MQLHIQLQKKEKNTLSHTLSKGKLENNLKNVFSCYFHFPIHTPTSEK